MTVPGQPPSTPSGSGRGQEGHDSLAADVAARLRVACAHLSDDEFASLVGDIVRMKMRFRAIDADPRNWRRIEADHPLLAPLPEEQLPPGPVG